ncbi:protein of unknown function [Paenibacillus alvei]|uniref:Uncharacterized protein n=1 Tax=Paenibacillus alvei TaxID=44250 RepID=A0A383RBW2_PAEAL|nr:protein of unknown function [Paenibacillus alvei]
MKGVRVGSASMESLVKLLKGMFMYGLSELFFSQLVNLVIELEIVYVLTEEAILAAHLILEVGLKLLFVTGSEEFLRGQISCRLDVIIPSSNLIDNVCRKVDRQAEQYGKASIDWVRAQLCIAVAECLCPFWKLRRFSIFHLHVA